MAMTYRIIFFIACCFLIKSVCVAQNYSIGHVQENWIDPTRSNRNVTCEIYYPSNNAGDNVTVATGAFPVVVIGHGFVMSPSVYDIYWEALVPEGYIVVVPTTEGSLFPSHDNFGKDMAFLVTQLQSEGAVNGSLFWNAVATTSAVMGHSMGGGAAFLAMNENPSITALVAMAPAETNPSAISAASTIDRPALVFSGINDCVAPPAEHQIPMYEALSSSCKTYLGIVGGDHCQFASPNFNCTFGQSTCSPQGTISATEQQADVLSNLIPWLDYYLKNDCVRGETFQSNIAGNVAFEVQQNCVLGCGVGILNESEKEFAIYPNPFEDQLNYLVNSTLIDKEYRVVDVFGKKIIEGRIASVNGSVNTENWSSGLYFFKVQDGPSFKVVKP